MKVVRIERVGALLAGLWGGVLIGIGLIGAPAGFSVATSDVAGRAAGRMFAQEAHAGLALALLLFLVARRRARATAEAGSGSVISAEVLLVLGALFCTVAGYFALQPMLAAARAGQSALSFGALHGLSAGFYALKTLLVVALAWRLTAAVSRPPSS